MGQLISIGSLKENEGRLAPWYFDDSYYSIDARSHRFAWPSKQFPHMVSIHEDIVLLQGNRPKINKWITECIVDTVIYDIEDKSYRIYYTKDQDWAKSSSMPNNWYRFWFSSSGSALSFKLVFSDIASDITPTHPTRHYDPIL